jgi:imidazolonepropionase-like amidohydrolase
MKIVIALLAMHCATTTFAQDLQIVNARIIDGTGAVIERGALTIESGRIAAVGADALDDIDTIDAAGMTVMPGLINAHWHLFAGSDASTDAEVDAYLEDAVRPALENILERGVTTIMSPGDHYPDILEVRERLQTGDLRGPRLLAVGPVFTSPGDWPTQLCSDDACNRRLNAEVDSPEAAREKVRELAAAGVDALKLVYDDGIVPDRRIDDDVVAAIADEADRFELRLYAHLGSSEVSARHLIDLGVDAFVHSVIDLTEALDVMVENGIAVNSTTTVALSVAERIMITDPDYQPSDTDYRVVALEALAALSDAGVVISFGTDSVAGPPAAPPNFLATSDSGTGLFLAEVRSLSQVLSNEAVIATLTRDAAVYLGIDDQVGTLESGKVADLVFIDGDPLADLDDLERVRLVIQGGKVVVDRR